jgi:hypothetical protein
MTPDNATQFLTPESWDLYLSASNLVMFAAMLLNWMKLRTATAISGVNGLTCWVWPFLSVGMLCFYLDTGAYAASATLLPSLVAQFDMARINYSRRTNHWWRVNDPRN